MLACCCSWLVSGRTAGPTCYQPWVDRRCARFVASISASLTLTSRLECCLQTSSFTAVPGCEAGDDSRQLIRLIHRIAIELEDDVARLNSGAFGGTAFRRLKPTRPLWARPPNESARP